MGATLRAGETAELDLDPSRHAYLVAVGGAIEVNGARAEPRDGIAITGEERVSIKALADAEVVLVDARWRNIPLPIIREGTVEAVSGSFVYRPQTGQVGGDRARQGHAESSQIGRAWCRERVCRYG